MQSPYDNESSWDRMFDNVKHEKYSEVMSLARLVSANDDYIDAVAIMSAEAYLAGCNRAERLYLLNNMDESHAYAVLDLDDQLNKFLRDEAESSFISAYTDY